MSDSAQCDSWDPEGEHRCSRKKHQTKDHRSAGIVWRDGEIEAHRDSAGKDTKP